MINVDELFDLTNAESIIALSAHPDDIALSCGGIMRYLRTKPVELTLISCFTRSIYAPFSEEVVLSTDGVSRLRKIEDKKYAQSINAHYISLGLDDVSIRYSDNEDQWICDHPQIEPIFQDLVERLQPFITKSTNMMILCPLAIGIHRDHYLLKEAIHLIIPNRHNVFYYEDLPYGIRVGGPVVVEDLARKFLKNIKESIIDITEFIQYKIEDINLYKSQIYPDELAGVIQYAAQLDGTKQYAERIWVVGS